MVHQGAISGLPTVAADAGIYSSLAGPTRNTVCAKNRLKDICRRLEMRPHKTGSLGAGGGVDLTNHQKQDGGNPCRQSRIIISFLLMSFYEDVKSSFLLRSVNLLVPSMFMLNLSIF